MHGRDSPFRNVLRQDLAVLAAEEERWRLDRLQVGPKRLGITLARRLQLILAHSPQAKGRIERLWGILQDRRVSELHLANVTGMEEANAFFPAFLAHFNRTFAVAPETPGSAYRRRLSAAELDRTICFKHERVVGKDNIVRLDQVILQILPGPNRVGYAKATVAIQESLDHRFSVHYDGDRSRPR